MHIFPSLAIETWRTLEAMAPWLLFGFLIAGFLSAFVPVETVERHLGGRGLWPVVKAALWGVPLPLCSCSVIPVAASLRHHKAGKGAITAFLLSTPQTGVDSILVTLGLLGPVFAVVRPLLAFLTGIVGGGVVEAFDQESESDASVGQGASSCCCCQGSGRANRVVQALRYGFRVLPGDIAVPLLVGALVAGFLAAVVPPGFFTDRMGSGFSARLLLMAVAIPAYVCATASVPLAAAMIAKGISPGAALVFLVTGPATNAATLGVLWRELGRRTTVIYLLVLAVSALGAGWLVDQLAAERHLPVLHGGHRMMHGLAQTGSAIALLAILVWARATRGKGPGKPIRQT